MYMGTILFKIRKTRKKHYTLTVVHNKRQASHLKVGKTCLVSFKFGSVFCLIGRLPILFNSVKTIWRHMENVGLDELWTEAGVFVINRTETMLQGCHSLLSRCNGAPADIRSHVVHHNALCLNNGWSRIASNKT